MNFASSHTAVDRTLGPAVDEAITRTVAIAALGGIALIHVLQSPAAFREEGYLGALFLAAVVGSVLLAATLTRTSDTRVVAAAGALAGLILIGYILSRTSGLPGATDDVGEWTEPLGLASMVVEGLLVCLAAGVMATSRMPAASAPARAAEAGGRRMPGAQPGATAG
jgi:hypothetical protein